MGMPGHPYAPPPDISHPHAQRPGQMLSSGGVGGGGILAPTASVPVDLSTLHHGHSGPTGASLQGIEPQLGSLSMQLGGYPSSSAGPQYSQFPQQSWPAANYPFTITQASATSVPQPLSEGSGPPPTAHRTAQEPPRGEESPMMGVCVQQSPVASH